MRFIIKILFAILLCILLVCLISIIYDQKSLSRLYRKAILQSQKHFIKRKIGLDYQKRKMLNHYFQKNENILSNTKLKPIAVAKKLRPLGNKLSRKERRIIFEMLSEIKKKFATYQINYYMDGGTLLGSYRHHNLIPWDDDVDLAAPIEMRPLIQSLWPESSKKHPNHTFYLYQQSRIDKMFHKDGRFTSGYPWKFPFVDIFYYRTNRTYVHRLLGPDGSQYKVPIHALFPIHVRPLGDLTMNAPSDTMQVLRAQFSKRRTCRCVFGGYSHMIEGGIHYKDVDCSTLKQKVSFVKRSAASNSMKNNVGIKETLMFRGEAMHEKIVDEPSNALSKMFCY